MISLTYWLICDSRIIQLPRKTRFLLKVALDRLHKLFFVSDKLRRSCRATRHSLSSAWFTLLAYYDIQHTHDAQNERMTFVELQQPSTLQYVSIIFNPQCRCFGARRHTIELKLSFAFCVCQPSIFQVNLRWINLRILAGYVFDYNKRIPFSERMTISAYIGNNFTNSSNFDLKFCQYILHMLY